MAACMVLIQLFISSSLAAFRRSIQVNFTIPLDQDTGFVVRRGNLKLKLMFLVRSWLYTARGTQLKTSIALLLIF
jgi:hypothetical protein